MIDVDLLAAFGAFERSINLAETTIRNRESILRTMSCIVGKSLLAMELEDLRGYLGRRGVRAGTRRTDRAAIRAFYKFALEDGHLDCDLSARLKPIHVPKGEPRPFTPEQVEAMLTSGAYRKTRAMILLGYHQGFRVSQIARVHGHDIDLLSMTIRTVGKGSKERVLPLHPVVAELAETMPKDDWWFPARGGRTGHMHPASVTDNITDAKRRAGILDPKLTPHSLRHSFGTELVEAEVDIRVVKELMTHESLATTQIYTRVSDSAQARRHRRAARPRRAGALGSPGGVK